MKKKSRIIAGLLCLCMAGSLCACGEPEPTVVDKSVGEGQSVSASETTVSGTASEETESETASTTSEGIKVKEESLSSQGSSEADASSAPDENDSTGEGDEGSPRVTNCGFDKITEEQAVEVFFNALNALNEQDWDTVVEVTNFYDVCRFEVGNEELTEEEFLKELKDGTANQHFFEMNDWEDQSEIIEIYKKMNPVAVRMTDEELEGLNDAIKRFNSLSTKIDNPPQYQDGYVIDINSANLDGRSANRQFLYVLEDENNSWRFDICFGVMFAMEDYFKDAIESPDGLSSLLPTR